MNHILINKDNYDAFQNVLPIDHLPDKNRITIGACSEEGDVAGAVSFALSDYQYDIDWLYVAPPLREQGVATGLLDEVFSFIRGSGEIYPVSAVFEATEDDEALARLFMERDEFDTDISHYRYYVKPSELASSQELKRTVELELEDAEFFSLPQETQNSFLSQVTSDHKYLIEDKSAWKEVCIPRLTRVVCRDDKLMAAIFIMGRQDGNLELSYLYSTNPVATKLIVSRVAEDIIKSYPGAKLIFDTTNDKAQAMAKKLFPNSRTVPVYEATW